MILPTRKGTNQKPGNCYWIKFSTHTNSLKRSSESSKCWEDMDSDVYTLDPSTICCRLFTLANTLNFSSLGKYSNYFNSYPLTSEDRKWVTGRKDVWYSSPNIVFTLSYTEDPMWIGLYVNRQEALLLLPPYRHLWKITSIIPGVACWKHPATQTQAR